MYGYLLRSIIPSAKLKKSQANTRKSSRRQMLATTLNVEFASGFELDGKKRSTRYFE